eukprot:TRINITY_DN4381_c0_g2_i1.p1 TRINITY_DN4381_c0_g2~~TRINITY_DN4381_c0_g2_i1.p1  ORF type:complete len:792 (-),score=241.84 TRINITY_DN4381_c0_g2_i1:183-2519(-)
MGNPQIAAKVAAETPLENVARNVVAEAAAKPPKEDTPEEKSYLAANQIMSNLASAQGVPEDEAAIPTIMDVIKSNLDNKPVLLPAIETLGNLLTNDKAAARAVNNHEGVETLQKVFDKYFDLLEFLRRLAWTTGKMATTRDAQTKIGKSRVLPMLEKGLRLFPDDVILSTNVCFCLSNVVYNHTENASIVLSLGILKQIFHMVNIMVNQPRAMEFAALALNNMCFRNNTSKVALGRQNYLEPLATIHKEYTRLYQHVNVVRNTLKAIGNMSLIPDNANTIIKNGFVGQTSGFVDRYMTQVEPIRMHLMVFGNLAVEDTGFNITNMLSQGAVECIIKCLKAHELVTDLLIVGVDALGNLIKTKEQAATVGQKGGIEAICNILKSQDFHHELVLKCVKMLYDMTIAEANIDIITAHKGHEIIVNIIKSQRMHNDILILAFKMLQRICYEKTKAKMVFNAGAVDACLVAGEEPGISPEAIVELLGLLSKLTQYDEANAYIGANGSRTVTTLLSNNMAKNKVVQIGVILMHNLLSLQGNIDYLIQNQVIDILNESIKINTTDSTITRKVFASLSIIALASEELRLLAVEAKSPEAVKTVLADSEAIKDPSVESEGNITYLHLTQSKHGKAGRADLSDVGVTGKNYQKLSRDQRNFLTAGKVIKLYKGDGEVKEMHLFMTNDLRELLAKRPKHNSIKQQWRLPIHQIMEIKSGYDERTGFAKSTGLFGKKKPNPAHCFQVIGPTSMEGQKVFYCEAANEIEAKKWVEYLGNALEDYKSAQKFA